jgi:hypothetical protein
MDKNTFIKISAALFVFFSLIISLFPPFEFGNEKLRTLQERNANSKIIDTLPIKQYDFIFHNNKKYFVLDSTGFQKLLAKESLEFYKEKWKDKEFKFIRSIDSFFTAKGFLYPIFSNERYENGSRKINTKLNYKEYGLVILHQRLDEMPSNYFINYSEVFKHQMLSPQEEWMLNQQQHFIKSKMKETDPSLEDDDFIKNAINYWDVKREYEKEPYWNWTILFHFDSSGKYEEYNITQPVYYLLDRNILFNELLVEYILALFVSLVTGYIIQKINLKLKKS